MSVAMILIAATPVKAAPAGDRPAARNGGDEKGSFDDILKKAKTDSEPADKGPAGRRDAEETAPGWKTKGHSPWRSLELFEAISTDEQAANEIPAEDEPGMPGEPDLPPADEPLQPIAREPAVPLHAPAPLTAAPQSPVSTSAAEDGQAIGDLGRPEGKRSSWNTGTPEARSERMPGDRSAAQNVRAARADEGAPRPPAPQAAAERPHEPRGKPFAGGSAAADRGDPKMTIVSSQVAPAPVSATPGPAISPTGAAFVASLDSEGVLTRYTNDAAATAQLQQQNAARPVTTLKIQLHPAELGTVTAKLTGTGEQLVIEIQVENHEARHRLSTDSEAIVKALRGMGYDIDRITIQQSPPSSASPGGATNRENAFAAPDGRAGDRQDQSSRQESGRQHDENARGTAANGGDRGEARSGGVYI